MILCRKYFATSTSSNYLKTKMSSRLGVYVPVITITIITY